MAISGLQTRSFLTLLITCALVLLPAGALSWLMLDSVQQHFAEGYAINANQLSRERIFAPISKERALASRMAHSGITRQWLTHETNEDYRTFFFQDAEGFRQEFRDHAYFIINTDSRNYYFNSNETEFSDQPHYQLSPDTPADDWFFSTLQAKADFNINVDHNPQLNTTRLWFNILIREQGKVIGIAGSGIDLSHFILDFLNSAEGVTPIIIDRQGAIQIHPDASLIALNSAAEGRAALSNQIFSQLNNPDEIQALHQAMAQAEQQPGSTSLLYLHLQGHKQLLALGYIPELSWHVLTAVDLDTAQAIDNFWFWPLLALAIGMILVLLLLFGLGVDRLFLRPLRQLHQSAQALSAGHYDVQLPVTRDDELGELSRSFAVMAGRIRDNAQELESRVESRTLALQEANREMREAHRKIEDSIAYAGLIQQAILPHQALAALSDQCAVLWQPRDGVGGDFFLIHDLGDRYLLGVADCAGHGVPGAMMAMLGHAALEQAVRELGCNDPAALLHHADQTLRSMLGNDNDANVLATSMDIGLALVEPRRNQLTYAGARIALCFTDGTEVHQVRGGKRSLADKRQCEYQNHQLSLSGHTFYLCSDGLLDQSGGTDGFGFGHNRFAQHILTHAHLPLAAQRDALHTALSEYQGAHPQRDDVTVLCFHFTPSTIGAVDA